MCRAPGLRTYTFLRTARAAARHGGYLGLSGPSASGQTLPLCGSSSPRPKTLVSAPPPWPAFRLHAAGGPRAASSAVRHYLILLHWGLISARGFRPLLLRCDTTVACLMDGEAFCAMYDYVDALPTATLAMPLLPFSAPATAGDGRMSEVTRCLLAPLALASELARRVAAAGLGAPVAGAASPALCCSRAPVARRARPARPRPARAGGAGAPTPSHTIV